MDDAALFYSDYLDHLLNGQSVAAFIGHCFGGEVAFRTAAAWQRNHPGEQNVLLLDYPWHEAPDRALYELLHGIIPESMMNFWLVQNRKDIAMINSLACPGRPEFHGRIVYYRAMTAIQDEPGNQPIVESLSPAGRRRFRVLLAAQGGHFGMISPERWRDKAEVFELHDLDTTHRGMLKGAFVRTYADRIAQLTEGRAGAGT